MGRYAQKIGKQVGVSDLSQFSQNFLIAGMRLDNYSGSWLYIYANGIGQWCPPYTIGWMSPLSPLVQTGPTVEYGNGPAPTLLPSTNAGQPAQLTVYEDPVPPSPGWPFLDAFGQANAGALVAYACNVMTVTGTATVIPITYTSGRRAVVLQASKNNTAGSTIYIGDSAVTADDGVKGGIQLSPGMSYPLDISPLAQVYAITDTPNQKLIVAEAQ